MYFFKADISSFDDEAETVFIIPEQNADENGVPFEEKMITQTAEYKAFVKRTKTALVDCTYTQYQTDEPIADAFSEQDLRLTTLRRSCMSSSHAASADCSSFRAVIRWFCLANTFKKVFLFCIGIHCFIYFR